MAEEEKGSYDIGSILRGMREEYWQSLAESEETVREELDCVHFILGGEHYAFETIHAAEVIRIPKLVRVPKIQEFIVGVFNLRGEIIAAMDIRSLLGLSSPALTEQGRIIVVKGERFHTGLLVEEIRGVTPLPLDTFEPAVKSLSGSQRDLIRGQVRLDGELVLLLDIPRLLASPEVAVDHSGRV